MGLGNTTMASLHFFCALRNSSCSGLARWLHSSKLPGAWRLICQGGTWALVLYFMVVVAPKAANAQLNVSLRPESSVSSVSIGCSGGTAGGFPCQGINLYAHVPLSSMGGGSSIPGNDIWGWTSPVTGIDYALVGRTDGTRIIDLSDPENPIYLGSLPRTAGTNITPWRDIKVYDNHAYVVADFSGGTAAQRDHGMQVFNLLMLDSVDRTAAMASPLTFTPTTTYHGFANAHNLAIDESTGYAYALGTNTYSGGLHMINLQNPDAPVAPGGYSGDGYSHDAQVVLYNGPDGAYAGHEVAFGSDEDTLTIIDVTNKAAPVQLSRETYPLASYAHQGWLTPDQHYFIMDDELDEISRSDVNHTRTHVWDVSDLTAPKYLGSEPLRSTSTDHNLYTYGNLVYEANYNSGLRVLDTRDVRNGDLYEIGWFDIVPGTDATGFDGAWSVYRFADSGVTIVNGINQGLFVLDTSGLVAGTPTMGVMNGGFEQLERAQIAATLPVGDQITFTGSRYPSSIPDDFDYDIPGWVGPATNAAIWHVTTSDLPAVAPDGANVLLLRSALTPVTVSQTLVDVLAPDTLYTLSVEVGSSLRFPLDGGYDIGLFAGDTLLAHIRDTDPGAPAIVAGQLTTVEFTVDSRDFVSLQGLPLEVRLSTRLLADSSVLPLTLFDNVVLNIQPLNVGPPATQVVPEPTSGLALWGCLVCAVRLRRTRRRTIHADS